MQADKSVTIGKEAKYVFIWIHSCNLILNTNKLRSQNTLQPCPASCKLTNLWQLGKKQNMFSFEFTAAIWYWIQMNSGVKIPYNPALLVTDILQSEHSLTAASVYCQWPFQRCDKAKDLPQGPNETKASRQEPGQGLQERDGMESGSASWINNDQLARTVGHWQSGTLLRQPLQVASLYLNEPNCGIMYHDSPLPITLTQCNCYLGCCHRYSWLATVTWSTQAEFQTVLRQIADITYQGTKGNCI